MYTLGGGIYEDQGWGRAGETFAVKDELRAYDATPQWFGLGDLDIATHLLAHRIGWRTACRCRRSPRRLVRAVAARRAVAADVGRTGRDTRVASTIRQR